MRKTGYKTPGGHCAIYVNESVGRLKHYLDGRKNVVITDTNVRRLYPGLLADYDVIEIPSGEAAKTLLTVEQIYANFLKLEIDRSSVVLGIGGGVVSDIAGFAASTFLRGIPFAFVPTTLLAQVDAAVGGKNGVNLDRYKNIVGVFSQPRFILVDFGFLKTLPAREFRNGTAEIIKHALIASPSLFDSLEKIGKRWLKLKRNAMETIVLRSINIKTKIVRADERERGERRKLNFGHTLGHAIERVYGLRHGEAVSIGMVMAAAISASRGMISGKECARIEVILRNAGLPVRIPPDAGPILDAVGKDKKRFQDDIHFVLLSGIGKAEVHEISIRELEGHIRDLCQHR